MDFLLSEHAGYATGTDLVVDGGFLLRDTPQLDAATDVRAVLRDYHAGMVAADVARLEALVAPNYSLVHITGYIQPKREWFGVISSEEFDYHRIDVEDRQVSVASDGNAATVIGRGIFDATISGMHAPWRLQFAVKFDKQGGAWKIRYARYSSF